VELTAAGTCQSTNLCKKHIDILVPSEDARELVRVFFLFLSFCFYVSLLLSIVFVFNEMCSARFLIKLTRPKVFSFFSVTTGIFRDHWKKN